MNLSITQLIKTQWPSIKSINLDLLFIFTRGLFLLSPISPLLASILVCDECFCVHVCECVCVCVCVCAYVWVCVCACV